MKVSTLVSLLAVVFIGACARKQAKTAEDLQQAFQNPTAAGGALSAVKPEVKVWVDQAVTALKADDQVTAVMSLRSLRSNGDLTSDQSLVVGDMMARAQGILAERAARGDQQAIAALNMLMANPPR
jgi:hypothetical protein